jgi:arylformamidase
MRVIDLTLPLNADVAVYTDIDGYRDPAYSATPWATVAEQGYSVHRLELGSHTGTHLDAPAHFHEGGRTVDQIPPSALVGRAVPIDVRGLGRVAVPVLRPHAGAIRDGRLPLFLAPNAGVLLGEDAVAFMVTLRPRLILYAGQFIDERERYHHNRVWLGADIPLVTDLDLEAAAEVRGGDVLIAAPLPLEGLDGSPCRVFVLQKDESSTVVL